MITIKNPYFVDDVEQFFENSAQKLDNKLQTTPLIEKFTKDQIKEFLENEILIDPVFGALWEKVRFDISLSENGPIAAIKKRFEKRF